MCRPYHLVLAAALTIASASMARAQPALERVVGPGVSARPLIVTTLNGQTIGGLAAAAGVPMGFEAAPRMNLSRINITATGMTLRAVLEAILAADSRYEWREDDGVVVLRPRSSWLAVGGVLDTAIAPLTLPDVQAVDALNVVSALFGVNRKVILGPGDTKHFSVDLPAGTLLAGLNGLVRAHGTMAWTVVPESSRARAADFPILVSLFVGTSGVGVGVPRNAIVEQGRLPDTMSSRERPARETAATLASRLDRIVGTRRDGEPLVLHGVFRISALADAVGVPMGVEMLPPAVRALMRRDLPDVSATGLPLRQVLAMLGTLDPRYEWRDMEGVIVFRPVDAWRDGQNPLFRLVNNVRLENATMSEAAGAVTTLLGSAADANPPFPDSRHVSVDLPQGTMLELLNALAASHGEMSWEWAELSLADRRHRDGRRYTLTFSLFGGTSLGFTVP